jgi:ABC-type sugar transport system substrate-binding protein
LFRVKVALYGPPDEFTQKLRRGLEAAAEANHLALALSEDERKERPAPPIAMPAQEKTDAMIVCAVDAAQAEAVVGQANRARIPVFTALFPAASGAVVAHITDGRREVSERSARSARPEEIGWKTIETVAAYLRGEKVPPVIAMETDLAGEARSRNPDGGDDARYHDILPAASGAGDSSRGR